MSNTGDAGSAVQSVDRAVTLLELLARSGETGVTELARELGVHKSTAFRLVAALERRELVEQVGERGKYRLGFGIVRLAGAATARLDLVQQSREACASLAARVGETVNIAVLDGAHAVNVSQARGPSSVGSHNWVGQLTPVHATSSGKVLLAFAAPELRGQVLAAPLTAYTSRTVTSPAVLDGELAEIRAAGWAHTVEELELGLNAVAAPIRGHDGEVIAALSASGPSYRLTRPRMADVAADVRATAEEIGVRMGYSTGTAGTPKQAPKAS